MSKYFSFYLRPLKSYNNLPISEDVALQEVDKLSVHVILQFYLIVMGESGGEGVSLEF